MLIGKLKNLMEKKGEQVAPDKLTAKKNAVEEMKSVAKDAMKGGLDGLKKVTVASPTQEGIAEGLDKAKELVKSSESAPEEASEEAEESPEEKSTELEHPELENIEELLQKLPPEKLKALLINALKG